MNLGGNNSRWRPGAKIKTNNRFALQQDSWLLNATRSMGKSVVKSFETMAPATYESSTNVISNANQLMRFIKDFSKNGSSEINKRVGDNEYVGMMKDAIKNAKEDLKSGNFNNTAREEKVFNEAMGFDDIDMGDMDFSLDDNMDSSSDIVSMGDDSGSSASANLSTAGNGTAILDVMGAQTQAIQKSIAGSSEISMSVGAGTINAIQSMHADLSNGLKAINDNLSALVSFNNEVIINQHTTTMKFYEDIMKLVQSIALPANGTTGPPNYNNVYTSSGTSNPLYNIAGTNGGLNIENLFGVLKGNATKMMDNNLYISMAKLILGQKDMLKGMAANPLGVLTQSLVTSIIPKATKAIMQELDTSISSFVPAFMMKMNRNKDKYDNPILQMMGELFGIESKMKKKPDFTSFKNEGIPFDKETKMAVTEIIPGYLRQILASITGKEEKFFDYKSRKFVNAKDAQSDFERRKRQELVNPFYDTIDSMMRNAPDMDYKSQQAFRKKMENMWMKFAENDRLFDIDGNMGNGMNMFGNLNKKYQNSTFAKRAAKDQRERDMRNVDKTTERERKRKEQKDLNAMDLDAILLSSGFSGDELPLIKSLLGNMSKGTKMKAFSKDILNARTNLTQFMERIENDPNSFLAASIFGSGDSKINNHLDSTGRVKKGFGLLDQRDQFGNSSLNYLRNIQDILTKGIRVFVAGNVNGSARHLSRYAKQMKEEKSTIAGGWEGSDSYFGDVDYGDAEVSLNMTDEQIETMVSNKAKANRINDMNMQESWFGTFLSRQLAKIENPKLKKVAEKVTAVFDKPIKFIEKTMSGINNTLYNIIFGSSDDEEDIDPNNPNAKPPKSMMGALKFNMQKYWVGLKDWSTEHIFKPLKESLFGKEGIITQIKESQLYQKGKEKIKLGLDYVFGEKDQNGDRRGGLFSDAFNETKDIFRATGYYVTGKKYTDSKGNTFETNDKSIFGEMRNVFSEVSNSIKLRWFGKKNEKGEYEENDKGLITSGLDKLALGFKHWGNLIFGKSYDDGKPIDTKAYTDAFKAKMPKALAWAGIGGALSLVSPVGLVGSLFLPSGFFGGAIAAGASAFALQSEKVKNFLFGDKDPETDERMGGVIRKSTQTFFRENKIPIMAGAGLGALKGLIGLSGGGLMGSLIIGGPIGGAIMGAGASMALKSQTFQNFMFGEEVMDENGDPKRVGGILSKLKFNWKSKNKDDNSFGDAMAGAIGGAGLGLLASKFGVLGGMLTLGSGPLFGSIMGAAAGISLSSKKFQEFIFGKDVDGTKQGGLMTKFTNWFKYTLLGPVRDAFDEVKINVGQWFSEKILLPVKMAVDPIVTEFKALGNWIKDMFKSTMDNLNSFIKDSVVSPIGSMLKSLLNPMGKMMKNMLMGGIKGTANLAALPFQSLNLLSSYLQGRQEHRGLKNYKSSIDENYDEIKMGRKFAKGKVTEGEWRKSVRDRKHEDMTDEDWSQYRDYYMGQKRPSWFRKTYNKYFDAEGRHNAMYSAEFGGADYADGQKFRRRLKDERNKIKEKYQSKKDKLAQQKEQTSMRKAFAQSQGWDNFTEDGENRSWVFDPTTYFKKNEKTGELEAWQKQPKTETTEAVKDINAKADKIIDAVQGAKDAVVESAKVSNPDQPVKSDSKPKTLMEQITQKTSNNVSNISTMMEDALFLLKVMTGRAKPGDKAPSESDGVPGSLATDLHLIGDGRSNIDKKNQTQEEKEATAALNKPLTAAEKGMAKGAEKGHNKLALPAATSNLPTLPGATANSNALAITNPKKKVLGKNVLQYQEELKKRQQEEKEQSYKETMMGTVKDLRDQGREHFDLWDFIWGKKGILTAVLLGLGALLAKLMPNITVNGGFGSEGHFLPGEGDGITNSQLRESIWKYPLKQFLKTKFGQSLVKGMGRSLINAFKETGKGVAERAGKETAEKVAKEAAEKGAREAAEVLTDQLPRLGAGTGSKIGAEFVEGSYRVTEDRIERMLGNGSSNLLQITGSTADDIIETGTKRKTASAVIGATTDRVERVTAEQVVDTATRGATANIGEEVIDVSFKEVGGNTMETIAKGSADGVITKFTNLVKKLFKSTFESEFVQKKLGAGVAAKCLDGIMKKLSSCLIPKVLSKWVTKISAAVAKSATKLGLTLGTAGVIDAAFAVYDLGTGATASETANIFHVDQESVTAGMRVISSIIKCLLGISWVGPLVDIVSEIASAILGMNIKELVATVCYKSMGGDADYLETAKFQFKSEFEEAQKEDSTLTLELYNNQQNRTVSSKIADLTGLTDMSVQKWTGMGRHEEITKTDRLATMMGTVGFMGLGFLAPKSIKKKKVAGYKKMFDTAKEWVYAERNSKGQIIDPVAMSTAQSTADEWNNMISVSTEDRANLANDYYIDVITQICQEKGYASYNEITDEDHMAAFGQAMTGECPTIIEQMFGLGDSDDPCVKWSVDQETGQLIRHTIDEVQLVDGLVANRETGMIEIDKDKLKTKYRSETNPDGEMSIVQKAADMFKKGVDKAKEGVKWVYNKGKEGLSWLTGGATNDDKVRSTLGLDEDTEVTFGNRVASGLGNIVSGITGGKFDATNIALGIQGIQAEIGETAAEFWEGTKEKCSEGWEWLKTNTNKGLEASDNWFGHVFGFKDKDGNPIKLSEKVKQTADEAGEWWDNKVEWIRNGASNFWEGTKSFFKGDFELSTANLKDGAEKLDEVLGKWLGFTDDEGNSMSLSKRIKTSITTNPTVIKIKDAATAWWDETKKSFDSKWETLKGNLDSAMEKVDKQLGSWFGFVDEDGNSMSVSEKAKETTNYYVEKTKTWWSDLVEKGKEKISGQNNTKRAYGTNGRGGRGGRGYGRGGSNNPEFVNNFAYYSQNDPKWSGSSYNVSEGETPDTDNSMSYRGCGPTAMSMVAAQLTRNNVSPKAMADYATQSGFSTQNGTTYGFFNAAANRVGINSARINPTTENVQNASANGQPMIFVGDGGAPFTSGGHYIVGVRTKGNKILVNDPLSKSRSRTYNVDDVVKHSSAAWAFDNKPMNVIGKGLSNKLPKHMVIGRGVQVTAADVLAVAQSQLGYLEKSSNSNLNDFTANSGGGNYTKYGAWYSSVKGVGNPNPWCAFFVSWCFWTAANEDISKGKDLLCGDFFSYCGTGSSQFKSAGRWRERNAVPEPGDVIFFGTRHVGIVVSADSSTVHTIEGNSSEKVQERSYPIGGHDISGYGIPKYDDSSSSNRGSSSSSNGTTTKSIRKEDESLTPLDKLQRAMQQMTNGMVAGNVYGEDWNGLNWDEINGVTYEEVTVNADGSQTTTSNNSSEGTTQGGSSATAEAINRVLTGSLAGMGDKYVELGNKYGVDPALAAAISMQETGGSSAALSNHNNPAGIMDWDNNYSTVRHFDSLEAGLNSQFKTIKNLQDSGKNTIAELGSVYCPVGAANDPYGLNGNWVPGVNSFYDKMTSWAGGGRGGQTASLQSRPLTGPSLNRMKNYLDSGSTETIAIHGRGLDLGSIDLSREHSSTSEMVKDSVQQVSINNSKTEQLLSQVVSILGNISSNTADTVNGINGIKIPDVSNNNVLVDNSSKNTVVSPKKSNPVNTKGYQKAIQIAGGNF